MNQKQMLELHKMVSDLRDEVAQMRDLIKGMTTPLDTKQSLPDPPAEIHLPQVLALQELSDLLCEHPYAECEGDRIWDFEIQYDEIDNPDFLRIDLESGGYYLLSSALMLVGDAVTCYTREGKAVRIDLNVRIK